MRLERLSGRYAVARLPPTGDAPEWAAGSDFVSVTHTRDETSIVCAESLVPGEVQCERGFTCLRVPGPIPFTEVGVLESIARPLASAGVSIFAISTFDTDYVFVRASAMEVAREALSEAGHSLATVLGTELAER